MRRKQSQLTPISGNSGSGSQTYSSSLSKRRARVSASLYEPPSADNDTDYADNEGGTGTENEDPAENFRRRIEALKQDMGEGWLQVFSRTQMASSSSSPGGSVVGTPGVGVGTRIVGGGS